MKSFLVGTYIALTIVFCSVVKSTGNNIDSKTIIKRIQKIVGGRPAKIRAYPWMVAIQLKPVQLYSRIFCGGVLISEQYILSAAHCFLERNYSREPMRKSEISVRIGGIDLRSTALAARDIDNILYHEKYDEKSHHNDIAIIKLKQKIDVSKLNPVSLPNKTDNFTGLSCIVTGWGNTTLYPGYNPRNLPFLLRKVKIPIQPQTTCVNSDPKNKFSEDLNICAGFKSGGKDSCSGDSGGPLVCYPNGKPVLAGLVSWGYGCAHPNYFGYYVKVSAYLDWIAQNMK